MNPTKLGAITIEDMKLEWKALDVEAARLFLEESTKAVEATAAKLERAQIVSKETLEYTISV